MFQNPELNLVDEVFDLLFTDTDCSPISSPYIWRRFQRTPEGRKVNCEACNPLNSSYTEGQKECPYCKGYGYVFNDQIISGYLYKQRATRDFSNLGMKVPAGTTDVSSYTLFTDSKVNLVLEDRILIPTLDDAGKIAIPFHINETCKCLYSRYLKASNNKEDYNIALLGG